MRRASTILIAAALLGGCAGRSTVVGPSPATQPVAATPPARDPKALLTLDQIQPPVTLALPATQPTTRPSLEAIQFYARARASMLANERFAAIELLRRAIALDPTSAELQQAMARAHLGTANFNEPSILALEKAAALQPDSLEIQLELGQQYLNKGDLDKSMQSLRRAMLSPQYKRGDDLAALTDFYLATALQRSGYDRAALDRYKVLLNRFKSPGPALRGNPQVNYLLSRVDQIYLEQGALHERAGDYEDALAAYQAAAERDDENFDLQARIVRVLAAMGRNNAKDRAADAVRKLDARPEALTLLRDTHRAFGNEAGAIDALQTLYDADRGNRRLLNALADTMRQLGQRAEARQLLRQNLQETRFDPVLVERLHRVYEADGDWQAASRLLIEASAERPDSVNRLIGSWSRMLRSTARPRVRLSDIAALQLPVKFEPARQYWLATLAEASNRQGLAKSAREQSLQRPLFAPAYRAALLDALADDVTGESADVKALLERAAASPALAAELRGRALMAQKKHAEAEAAFRRADELESSAALRGELAQSLIAQKKDNDAENALWSSFKICPAFEPAYLALINFYAERGRHQQTLNTLDAWLKDDPASITARTLQARFLTQSGRPDLAEAMLQQMLAGESDDPEVLGVVAAMYQSMGKLDALAGKLADMYAKAPANRALLEQLVDAQIALGRKTEATRLVDAARVTFATDADALYLLSGLYQRLDQKQANEDMLLAALKVDPTHAGASNDLGYNWVDAGRNLDRAESLVRQAVAVEPDNQAFLDSLGWALYKRGQFAEAVKYLQQASEGDRPDPIVLDHLGDAMYRAGRVDEARSAWEQASKRLEKLETSREDLKQLKLQLNNKLRQAKDARPVSVAPIVEPPAPATQRTTTLGPSQEKRHGRP